MSVQAPPEQASCLYEGTVRHRRQHPPSDWTHPLTLVYLDLEELPDLLSGRLVARRPGAMRFRRGDYLGDPRRPLAETVRERVAELGGCDGAGPVRLLTQLRSWGVCFNPVSFYYCYGRDGHLRAVLAEVTNTPWGERHSYLIGEPGGDGRLLRARFEKRLHVSPFMGMDHSYEARATAPGSRLGVHIASRHGGRPVFEATLALERRELTRASARRLAVRHPIPGARVLALIYGHALALKLAGAPHHPHPVAAR